MVHHVVIGTAGHIDHGKTALVKALTGVDTDRWEEEKRRGITIDLGFAALPLADDFTASMVDVPGHEDFVRNMVAGATGIDLALLVIAADEGVMPQTVEHVAILELLGVELGVVAITKTDLVEPDWLDLVVQDVTQRLGRSSVQWDRPVPVSAVTGTGLEDLRTRIAGRAREARRRAADDLFRLPIDRVFSLPGAGTVVTGTTWSGTVRVGDAVTVLPGAIKARVRSVESHGVAASEATPGRRTALALVGLERGNAGRGHVVVADESWRATDRLDVLVTLLPGTRSLTQRAQVKLHVGTAEVLARVTPLEDVIVPEKGPQAARLRLSEPIVTRWGDRGVLRAPSPAATIGGCVVVDPWPANRPRRPVGAEALSGAVPERRIQALVNRPGPAIRVVDLPVRAGLPPKQIEPVLARARPLGVVRVGNKLVPARATDAAREAILAGLRQYHRAHPLEPGMALDAVRRLDQQPDVVQQGLDHLVAKGSVVVDRGIARLPTHAVRIPAEQQEAVTAIRTHLEAARFQGADLAELQSRTGSVPAEPLVAFLVRDGTAVKLGHERYYDGKALEGLTKQVTGYLAEHGATAPSELRAVLGLTRKYLIPVLEWLDARGYTVREGDVRRLGMAGKRLLDGVADLS